MLPQYDCGIMPKTNKHLNVEERHILAVLKSQGYSLREIAEILKISIRVKRFCGAACENVFPPNKASAALPARAASPADSFLSRSPLRPSGL